MNLANIKNKILAFLADIRFYNFGLILWGDSHYKVKGPHQRAVLDVLKDGDILLRRYNNYLGSVFIPGYWSHAALYEGGGNVIHMLGKGITREDILTFMRTDDIAVLRCEDENKVKEAIAAARVQLDKGVSYDYDFNTDSPDELYCTELIDFIFGRLKYTKEIKKWILPDDMLNVEDFKIIWRKGH